MDFGFGVGNVVMFYGEFVGSVLFGFDVMFLYGVVVELDGVDEVLVVEVNCCCGI